ncbi:hypothetical protein F5B21DRAFT_221588 [Xylaria acuta]|nr:hypothetical protein F5B21DRAFT_221588 [Xylaria acuta]
MRKGALDDIVQKYKYLYSTPLFWTHRHEKALHVVWQHPAGWRWSPPADLVLAASDFPLINVPHCAITICIAILAGGLAISPCGYVCPHEAMTMLLSGVYNGDSK